MKMLLYPYLLNKYTLYTLDLTPSYLNHTKRVNCSLITQI
jgi:hypothetical protein